MNKATSPTLLFAGFGDIAQRVAKKISGLCQLHAIKRSPIESPSDITMHYADLGDSERLEKLIIDIRPDYILVALTPNEYNEQGYHKAYVETTDSLVKSLESTACDALVMFISSTSVYGQNEAEWVDETSITQPQKYNGRLLLQAENNLKPIRHCVLRCSGLYQDISDRMLQLSSQITEKNYRWSNRIHRDDVAAFIVHLISRAENKQPIATCYVVSDSQPEILANVLLRIGDSEVDLTQIPKMITGKRCNNKQMLGTQFQLTYPNYTAGYNL